MPNAKIERERRIRMDGLNDGILMGQQQTIDMFQIALRRKGWNYYMVKQLMDDVSGVFDEFSDAFNCCMDQEIAQDRMDGEINALIDGNMELIPFKKRYPLVKTIDMSRMPKGQKKVEAIGAEYFDKFMKEK